MTTAKRFGCGLRVHRHSVMTAGIPFDRAATEADGETITRAVLVCIAKEAARQVVEGKPEQA